MKPTIPTTAVEEAAMESEVINATIQMPKNLDEDSKFLLIAAFEQLARKMRRNEIKYGYSNQWCSPDWEEECRNHMMQHIQKGDPKDVAIYAMFMMHHNWPTKLETQGISPTQKILASLQLKRDLLKDEWMKDAMQSAINTVEKFANDYHEKHTFPAYESVLKEAREALTESKDFIVNRSESLPVNRIDPLNKINAALTSITNLTKNNQ